MPRPRKAATTAALCLLAFAVGPAFADRAKDRAAEKARKKAWEEAQEAFKRDYKSDDPKVRRAAVRKSHENPAILKLYEEFLTDGPCGHVSHQLLHTGYTPRGKFID